MYGGLFKPNFGEILFEDKAISKMDSEATEFYEKKPECYFREVLYLIL